NTWLDYAANQPLFITRVHNNANGKFGAYSTDGGSSWTSFPSAPAGVSGGGAIAVSADGSRLVWAPGGVSAVYYSTNRGASWAASTGISKAGMKPMADRVNAQKFYIYDAEDQRVLVSFNGGVSFVSAASNLPSVANWQLWAANVYPVPGKEGDVWLTNPVSGLYRSTNAGASFFHLSNLQEATKVGFGKPQEGATYPTAFVVGKMENNQGFFRTEDEGSTWTRISDEQHQFGGINDITGDPRVYGRVYLATAGRGILYGEPPGTVNGLNEGPVRHITYWPNPFR
ncbi:MAG: WD40/YVTN/BNR-like repeat-containing protein, partial [Rufibacter sp.]